MENDVIDWDSLFGGVLLMAGLHGLLLAIILFAHKKLRSRANRFLALSLFGTSIVLLYECSFYLYVEAFADAILTFLPVYATSTIPIGLYFFVTYLIQPEHEMRSWEKWWLLPIFAEILLDMARIPVESVLEGEENLQWSFLIEFAQEFIGLGISLVLMPLAWKKVQRYQKLLVVNYSTIERKSLLWLRNLIALVMILVMIWLVSFLEYILLRDFETTFAYVSLGLVLLLFWIGYFVILHNHLFQIVPVKPLQEENSEKKLSSNTDNYYRKLLDLMQVERLYEDTELTLDKLAQHLNISSGYLSQIINEKEKKNFFEFVNYYRIESVKAKLVDKDFGHYSILGIGLESGFNSKSTFNSVFKKFTGQTPSTFKRTQLQSSE